MNSVNIRSDIGIVVPFLYEHRYLISGNPEHPKEEQAGIRSVDKILTIHGVPSAPLSLDDIYKRKVLHNGSKIRLDC